MTQIALPTGSYQTADTRASNKRLLNCFSEIAPQTSAADLKSVVPPCYLRRMFGVSPLGSEISSQQPSTYTPSLLLHMDGISFTANASLLLHMDGANGQTTFTDSSSFAHVMAQSGFTPTVVVDTSQPKFGTGAANYGTTAGNLNAIVTPIVANGSLDLNSNVSDFTIEGWVLGHSASPSGAIVSDTQFTAGPVKWEVAIVGTAIQFLYHTSAGTLTYSGATTSFAANTWYAFAVVCHNSVVQIYTNGVGGSGGGPVTGTPNATSGTLSVGACAGATGNFPGEIDELRITQAAIYTANYTPSTVALTPVVTIFTPTFLDSSLNNFTMTAAGGATIVTSSPTPKFGGGDGSFPSTTFGSSVTAAITATGPLDLFGPVGGGNFTIQGFFQAPSFANPFVILDYGDSGSNNNGIIIEVVNSTTITVSSTVSGWGTLTNVSSGFTVNTWYSFALVRNGSTATLYINGIAAPNVATNWTTSTVAPGTVTIGKSPTISGTSQPFFLDEVVVYKGSALYTVNYTPPLTPVPNPLGLSTTPPVRGMWDMQGITYVVIGPSLYTLSAAGTLTFLATGIAGNSFVRMTDNTACLVIVVPGTLVAYTYTVLNGFSQLLTGPIGQFGAIDCWFVDSYIVFLALNGREFYNDDGQTVSGQGPITFLSGGVFPREFGTDPFVGMCVDHRTVLMFGTRTSEAYVNTGNPTQSPFSAAPDGFMQLGAHPLGGYTVALQDQSVFWLANDLTVRRRNGQTPVRVSNSGIEAILELNKENLLGCYALTATVGGHPLWILTIPAASRTLVYDCLTTEWFELESLINNLGYWRPLCVYNAQGLQLIGDSQSSQIGFLDASTFSEFTTTQRAVITCQSIYKEHKRITTDRVEMVVTCGEGQSLTAGASVTLMKSKDSGAIYTARQTRSLGPLGQRQARAYWTKLGQQRDLALAFQISDPTPLFTVDIQADITVDAA